MSRKAWADWLGDRATPASVAMPSAAAVPPVLTRHGAPAKHRPTSKDLQAYRPREVAQVRAADSAMPAVQEVEINPVPKPRMTRADRWAKRDCVLRYRAYADTLRLMRIQLPHAYRLEFVLRMPSSWSEATKSAMDGQPHLVRPDTSNLVKAVEDALVPHDERLHDIGATKVWGRAGMVRVIRVDSFGVGADVVK